MYKIAIYLFWYQKQDNSKITKETFVLEMDKNVRVAKSRKHRLTCLKNL